MSIIEPEPESAPVETAADVCAHFGDCGGCQSQNVPYEQQVLAKSEALSALFRAHWETPIAVTASPGIWHYRNKVDPNFGRMHYPEPPPKGFERELVLGFKRHGKWFWTLDMTECRIAPKGTDTLIAAVRDWAKERKLTAFSSKSKDGFLRALLVREGKRTGERMVVLVTHKGELDKQSFVDVVQSVFRCESIQWAVYRGDAEITAADQLELLHGKPSIEEVLHIPDSRFERKLKFRLSPFSFFQTNSLATELLYGQIRAWVRETRPSVLYDLYGGSGGIAFSCADCVDRVVSVESVESASVDGVFNRETNSIDDVIFLTQKVEDYLRETLSRQGQLQTNNVVVLDPPRAGLHPKALKKLLLLEPKEIIYVSCKPTVLAEELPALLTKYEIKDMRAFDLFPHTEHVELLARLTLKA